MRGVILAGGTGSRLFPSTKVVNKHLLPVFNKPMIYYPIQTLKKSGINEILIITTAHQAGDFMKLLGSGRELDVKFTYKVQDGAGGIAQALSLAEEFASNEPIAVILGDNIFENNFSEDIRCFEEGATIFVKTVENPYRFGVVEQDENGDVLSIEEKPSNPKSNLAQTGFAIYDQEVFDIIKTLEPSKRGELEITDINKTYLDKKQLNASEVSGNWIDAGTHESLLEANLIAQEIFENKKQTQNSTKNISTEAQKSPSVTIGIITHNSEKYITPCLESLQNQDYSNLEIVIFDNNSTDQTLDILQERFPNIRLIESNENIGFARSHNEIIRQTDSEFYACFNIDMIFEPNVISELVDAIQQKPIFGSSGGKIKRWDFDMFQKNPNASEIQGKTNFIDSAGIRILRSHRFEDRGQNEIDHGQYEDSKQVFGISGAAVLYRKKALEDIAFINEKENKEYFDESMFMYKEDIDIAYRLQWAGWKSLYTPKAVCYHDRTIASKGSSHFQIIKNRLKKKKVANRLSYINHHILLKKNFSKDFSSSISRATLWYNCKVFFYILLFETEVLTEWWNLSRLQSKIKTRKRSMPRRVSTTEIEKLIENETL